MRLETTTTNPPRWQWGLAPALLMAGAAWILFAWQQPHIGFAILAAAIGFAATLQAAGRTTPEFATDLALIGLGLGIIASTSVAAKLHWGDILRIGGVLTAAVAAPYFIDRYVLKRTVVQFVWRNPNAPRWGRYHFAYIAAVLMVGYLVLPYYFLSTGTYLNWPVVDSPSLLARLFVGVNAVGLWDELFFICTVFVLLRRHFVMWQANLLQAAIFVAFLWELGYRSWGPWLTIPFALVQGLIFNRTRSLPYVVTVHLLFDAFVFLVIARAHNPSWPTLFLFTG